MSSEALNTVADEIHLTATDWAKRSGLPYRAILRAVKEGQLTGYRPAGSARGSIYITGADFRSWIDSTRVEPEIQTPITRRDYYKREKRNGVIDQSFAPLRFK